MPSTKTPSGIVLPTFPERYITTKSGKTKKVEYKVILGELKATNDEQGIVEGYLNVVGNVDYGNDRTKSGAFKRTIDLSYKRKAANNYEYLWPYLWNHSTDLIPPGGIFDAEEDKKGLLIKARLNLDTQLGREMYSSYKFGSLNKQSMGYLAHKTEWVREGDENVRDLIEVEILEGSGVIFPMNDLADVTNVKSMFDGLGGVIEDVKAASGKTSWSLADKDTKWSGAQAKKDIQEWATSGDEVNWSKAAQCFFWVSKSPPEKLADCKMPFVAKVDGKMQAVPQGIISCAGIIRGAMGGADIDDVAGVKAKIATYYKKMDMTPPWEDDGKSSRRHMDRKDKEKKTVQEHYAEEMCKDLLEDWQDVFVCTLTEAVLDAFKIGDQPEQDVSQALDDFKELVLTKFVPEAIECDLSGYISDNSNTYSSVDSVMQYGSDSKPNYSYYSNDRKRDQKIGKPISADNQKTIDAHVKSLKALAKSAKAAMQEHTNAMHDTADSVADIAGDNTSKAGRAISAATAQSIKDYASTMHDHADKAMDIMKDHAKAVRTAADDLATRMQGAETPYAGDDPGTPDPGQQEGKGNDQGIPSQKTHTTQERPSEEDTVNEKDLELMLAFVQGIKTAV